MLVTGNGDFPSLALNQGDMHMTIFNGLLGQVCLTGGIALSCVDGIDLLYDIGEVSQGYFLAQIRFRNLVEAVGLDDCRFIYGDFIQDKLYFSFPCTGRRFGIALDFLVLFFPVFLHLLAQTLTLSLLTLTAHLQTGIITNWRRCCHSSAATTNTQYCQQHSCQFSFPDSEHIPASRNL